jgi:alpha-beta hydrolase superfamily lysophospholipase
MDPQEWTIKSHTISASHIRGFARGVRNPKADRLKLVVKQYTPKSDGRLSDTAATVIFCHGIGSTKESYEPLFGHLKMAGLEIRSVWAADIAWHGMRDGFNRFA